jgi:hypothetical protein
MTVTQSNNNEGDFKMLPKITGQKSIVGKAALTIFAFTFFQLVVCAQSTGVMTVTGQTGLFGLAREELLRFKAFNPATTEAGHPNQPISLRLKFYDEHGDTIAQSAEVLIPPGQFRSIDTHYDDLPIAADGINRKRFGLYRFGVSERETAC